MGMILGGALPRFSLPHMEWASKPFPHTDKHPGSVETPLVGTAFYPPAEVRHSPLLPLPLKVGPLNSATELRGLGERCKLPERGLGQSPSQNRIRCILALYVTFGGNKFNDFPVNQMTKFHAEFQNVI